MAASCERVLSETALLLMIAVTAMWFLLSLQ